MKIIMKYWTKVNIINKNYTKNSFFLNKNNTINYRDCLYLKIYFITKDTNTDKTTPITTVQYCSKIISHKETRI